MKTYLSSAITLTFVLVASSCSAPKQTSPGLTAPVVESATNCSTMNVTYTGNIKAIIDNNCAKSCHSASSHAAGIDLTTYEKVKAESLRPSFIGSLKHDLGFSPMPKKNPKLSDSTLMIISCWIESGSK